MNKPIVETFSTRKDKVKDSVDITFNGKRIIFRWIEGKKAIEITSQSGFFYKGELSQMWAIAHKKLGHFERLKKQGELFG